MSTWNTPSASDSSRESLSTVTADGMPQAADGDAPAQSATAGASEDETPAHGQVKWFNDQKGFGFISDDEGRDVFVHYAVIDGDGFKTLQDGEAVSYFYADSPRGRRATRVMRTPAR